MLLSGEDGEVVSRIKLPCQPVATPVLADFTGDGWNDVIVTCAERWVSACTCIDYLHTCTCIDYLHTHTHTHTHKNKQKCLWL